MIRPFRKDYAIHFFGKNRSLEDIREDFPHVCLLKQTHSDILVPADSSTPTGDAHWTQTISQPLAIQTADCLPVMMYLPKDKSIVAVHAGWRGVENRIVTKALRNFKVQKNDPIDVIIGPHIQQTSFEVDIDVARAVLKAHGEELNSDYCEKRGDKYHIQLSALVLREITDDVGLKVENRFVSPVDTKTHKDFYSYRDGDRGGRNYSLIIKNPL